MHMDQTYVFYAGQPWFVKEGRFDVIQDMHIEAMRDDEWVFSGYSFTNSVWLDAMGRLHEGAVPGEHADNMWGVGFIIATAPLKPAAWDILREVSDDQIYKIKSGIVDLGYVYDLRIRDGVAHVLVTMPHRGRPVYQFLVTQGGGRVSEGIRERLLKLNGIRKVVVDFTWHPEWTTARLTIKARKEFGWPEK